MMEIESSKVQDDISASLTQLEKLLKANQVSQAESLLEKLGPSSRLIVLSRLPWEARRQLFIGLPAEKAADFLCKMFTLVSKTTAASIHDNPVIGFFNQVMNNIRKKYFFL